MQTNRAKSDEFALIGVYIFIMLYFFCAVAIFVYVDLEILFESSKLVQKLIYIHGL